MVMFAVGLVLVWLAVIAALWVGYALIRQNGRILLRLEAIEHALSTAHGDAPRADASELSENATDRLRENLAGSLVASRIKRDGLSAGTPAPTFRLPRVGGGELALQDYGGRRVLLAFSDPHCGPCMELAPRLEALHRDLLRRESDIALVMVSRGDAEENRQKVADLTLTFPVVLQKQWEISRDYGIFATPVAYLIDATGTIAADVAVGADAILALIAHARSMPETEIDEGYAPATTAPHFAART